MRYKPTFIVNGWVTTLIIFFTMISLLIFKPSVYTTILSAILDVLKTIGQFAVFK